MIHFNGGNGSKQIFGTNNDDTIRGDGGGTNLLLGNRGANSFEGKGYWYLARRVE